MGDFLLQHTCQFLSSPSFSITLTLPDASQHGGVSVAHGGTRLGCASREVVKHRGLGNVTELL